MILDTTVLIDLQKEEGEGTSGPASRLLAEYADVPLCMAFVSPMEFAVGVADQERAACTRFLSSFRILWPDDETVWLASRVSRGLRAKGQSIGDHDSWIAALALQHGRPVASRNERHFRRVPGLMLTSY